MKNCYGDTPDYLCAPIENMLGRYGEICTIGRWIPEHECVVLNKQTRNLDSVDCKADTGCPSQTYLSSEVWRYTICYGNFYEINGTLEGDTPIGGDSVFGAGLAVAVVFIVIIVVVVVVLVVFYVTNKFGFRKKTSDNISNTVVGQIVIKSLRKFIPRNIS
uniref:Uncharacterized protein n=1 Tax=Magallana gigas TaxID=29159 RepID=K1QW55_MAGGI